MVKRSPALIRRSMDGSWEDDETARNWVCCSEMDKWWDLRDFRKIRICGSTKPTPGSVLATRGGALRSWCISSHGPTRMWAYVDWLRSFNSPCVWIWVEEA